MQLRHAVGEAAQPQRQHRHAERLLRPLRTFASERREHVAPKPAEAKHRRQRLLDHLDRIPIVSRRHGGVRREDERPLHRRDRGLDRFAAMHGAREHPHARERRVPLVEMDDRRPLAERLERHHAADTKQHLLLHAKLRFALVEAFGQLPIRKRVLREIRVEKQQARAADPLPPHPDMRHPRADRALEAHAGVLDRKKRRVLARIEHPRRAVFAQLLPVVAMLIEQPHRHEGNPQIARALDVVAREDPQSARVLRHRLVDRVLRAQIRDLERGRLAAPMAIEPRLRSAVANHLAVHRLDRLPHRRLGDANVQHLTRRLTQDGDGVVARRLPSHRIETSEEARGLLVPGPPEVVRDRLEHTEVLGDRDLRLGGDSRSSRGWSGLERVLRSGHGSSSRSDRVRAERYRIAMRSTARDPLPATRLRLPSTPWTTTLASRSNQESAAVVPGFAA